MTTTKAPVDRRIRRTRKTLRQALQQLLVEKQYEQITIREIAAAADIAYTTFFRHYPDKDSLLSDLADDEISGLLDLTLPMFSTTATHTSTLTLCEHVKRNERLWAALLTGGAAGNVRLLFITQVELRYDKWPTVMDWLPPEVGATVLCGITLDVLAWWLRRSPERSAEEVAVILDMFFTLTAR